MSSINQIIDMSQASDAHDSENAKQELFSRADKILAQAKKDEQIEVVVVQGGQTEIKAYESAVESLSYAESYGIGIRVISEGRQGFASAGTFDEKAIEKTLREARDNMQFATVDEYIGLAEPDGVVPVVLDVFRPGVKQASMDEKVAIALELEERTRDADSRIIGIETAEYSDSRSSGVIVSSTGIRSFGQEASCSVVSYALASDGTDVQTGFGYSLGREPKDLDILVAARESAERATRMLGAVKPDSGRVSVILDPWVTAQMLGIIGSTLNGESVLKGRSLFADRLGEIIANEQITLIDDPTNPEAFTATAVDGEGLATRKNILIKDGVLQKFVHNTYTARRCQTASTGSAIRGFRSTPGVGTRSLSLVPGSRTQEQLIASLGEGILIQDVAGLHSGVNPISGDFSTGAEGIRIRGGKFAEPLREFTIASTLQKMLIDVLEVGSDLVWLPMSASGVSLVLRDVMVSGL